MRGDVSRADLLRALDLGGEQGLEAACRALGVGELPERMERPSEPQDGTGPALIKSPPRSVAEDTVPGHEAWAPIPFWRVVRHRSLDLDTQEAALVERPGLTAADRDPAEALRPPGELVSWHRLLPRLAPVLSRQRASERVDVETAVDHLAEAEAMEEPPREARRRFPAELVLLLDWSPHLAPVREDMRRVRRALEAWRGRHRIQVVTVGVGGVHRLDRDLQAYEPRWPPTAQVLALSDLGSYVGGSSASAWTLLARRLVRRGHGLSALVPCPRARWGRAARDWNGLEWEQGRGMVPSAPGQDSSARAARVDRLLMSLSWLVRIDLGVLRSTRVALSDEGMDLGTEIDTWMRVAREGRAHLTHGLQLDDEWRADLRSQLAAELEAGGSWRALRVAQAAWSEWAGGSSPLLDLENALSLTDLVGQERRGEFYGAEEWERFGDLAEKIAPTILARQDDGLTAGWVQRLRGRLPPVEDRRLARAMDGALRTVDRSRAEPSVERTLQVMQLGDRLAVAPQKDDGNLPPAGRILGSLRTSASRLWIERTSASGSRRASVLFDERGFGDMAFPVDARWKISSERDDLFIERFEAPSSVDTVWCDEGGLAMAVPDAAGRVVFRWEVPAATPGGEAAGLWRPQVELATPRPGAPGGQKGSGPPEPGSWARAFGVDDHGVWATMALSEVNLRFRWIPPGRFLMGSPKDEFGRWSNETQHPVTLTSGFWLGEYPVTQDLWRAVTGESPSALVGDRHPVETISWDDATAFLQGLNDQVPGLKARLPTEAEWEYACRAGTGEATYAGDVSDEDQDPILGAIAWYSANSDSGTKPVGGKRPNAWGLHDMLGNVGEWCRDEWAMDLGTEFARDPLMLGTADIGREDSGPRRVVRGGAWSGSASDLRAACRDGGRPGFRNGALGFRLSRGQES